MRSGRQAVILEIISSMEIETQEELCAELTKRNYNVTQATVSRDIKELRLFKVAGVEKKYRYAYIDDGIGLRHTMESTGHERVVIGSIAEYDELSAGR